MEKRKAKGIVRIVIGILLVALQITVYLGVAKSADEMGVKFIEYVSWNIGTYSFVDLLVFNCFMIAGAALLIWGICAQKKSLR